MPNYTFICNTCIREMSVNCRIDERDVERTCPFCGDTVHRAVTGGLGLLQGIGQVNPLPARSTSPRPGITMTNCVISNCGGGVRMDGGHANIDGLQIIDTPTAFELNGGATVDMRNVSQTFTQETVHREKKGRRRKKADPQP